MKKLFQSVLSLVLVLTASAQTIPFQYELNLADYKGQTYLSFMESTVKPSLDLLAVEGYPVKGADAVAAAYELSAPKVQRKVDRQWGGLEHVQEIAAGLEGETATLETLPGMIRGLDREVDSYGLSTFLGLASGGGVSIQYAENNYALNVHYDTTEERSGRSFGVGPTRKANDASDKDYLDDVQEYSSEHASNMKHFYKALFESLLNSDSSHYPSVTRFGQTVLTDFLAVFTAEQARNLMDGRVAPHWDAALLEVTLLASFHAGQEEFKLFYKDPETQETTFTNSTLKQTPCEVPSQSQSASMRDYWQFSRNITNPQHCRRSGINITKSEFRRLEKEITSYTAENNEELYTRVKNSMGLENRNVTNLYEALSKYLIATDAERVLEEEKVTEITQAWVDLLNYSKDEAANISALIEAQ